MAVVPEFETDVLGQGNPFFFSSKQNRSIALSASLAVKKGNVGRCLLDDLDFNAKGGLPRNLKVVSLRMPRGLAPG